ncbi:MAG: helix-turn-helix domain-containing protein [Ruminococcaceae bacterium]|nr:helix-turn-helix domain-containing protein [Oscillospiraceae bacterium]
MAFFEDYGSDFLLDYQLSKSDGWCAPMHLHPHYEALLVTTETEQATTINGQPLPVISAPSLTIFAPFAMHRTEYRHNSPSERFVFYFGADLLKSYADAFKPFEEHAQSVFSRFILSPELLELIRSELTALREKPRDPTLERLSFCLLFYRIITKAPLELAWNQAQSLEKINKIIQYMAEHCQENLNSEDICRKFYISRSKLNKDFSRYFSITFHELLTEMRLNKAYFMLRGKKSIKEIARELGFEKDTYFYTFFKRYTGLTPLQWRKAKKTVPLHSVSSIAKKHLSDKGDKTQKAL